MFPEDELIIGMKLINIYRNIGIFYKGCKGSPDSPQIMTTKPELLKISLKL